MHELLFKAFPNLHYIWITRRDKVRQAISYSKALQTDTWVDLRNRPSSEATMANHQASTHAIEGNNSHVTAATPELTFDYGAIEGLRLDLEQNDGEIQQYFATFGIPHFKVVYEDFVGASEETIWQILDFLHIPRPTRLALGKERTLQKQANNQSEEWLQRYYQLKQQEVLERQDRYTVTEIAAQRYIQANVAPPDPREVNWKDKPLAFKLYRNCEQIPLGHEEARTGTSPVTTGSGSDAGVGLGLGLSRGQMLVEIYGLTRQSHSIPILHPMLKFLSHGETGSAPFYTSLLRPVPSGGALFPCELYLLVSENRRDSASRPLGAPHGEGHHLPAGIYHYDAAHHALDILAQGDFTSHLQSALAHPTDTPPAYTLLLSSFFWKDGFKYGAFSYRLQGLDIGTVISQSEIVTHHEGLSTTIHYQFQDKVLNDLLGLDPVYESVYAVIEWRQEENKADLQEAGASPAPTRFVGDDGGQGQAAVPTRFGTINARALERNETSPAPMTESIARWPLPEEIHRASFIETREAFRPLHTLAPIEPLGCEKTLALEASQPLDLWEARTKRHSALGNFLPKPLTRQQLSQLLRTSMCGTTNDLDGQSDFLQHTLLYCIVYRVTDIPPGVYRYQPEKHALELVRPDHMPYEPHRGLSIPNFYSLFYMSVNLFPVGNYKSGFAVYGDRWYRMQNMEAGMIAQRLYLAAAAQNLGCRASLSFPTSVINRFLGLSDAEDD